MKKLLLPILVAAQLVACGDDDNKTATNNTTNPCGAGQQVESDGELACVYDGALIEEGFSCPSIVPFGFLLTGGGVACVDSQQMPDPLIQLLDDLGFQPKEPGCFDADPAQTCFYTEPTTSTGAFDLNGANTISYTAGGGLGFCVDSLLDFTVDLGTGAATIGYLVPGDAANDNCLTMPPDCEVRAEASLTLDATQLQQVKDLYADVPAPQCQQNGPAVCDPCVIETLTVDEASVDTFCCAETAADFGPSVLAVADYLRSLIPVTTAAFSNPNTFDLMTYTTGGGLGYCLDADATVQATFTRQTDGSLSAEGTTAVVGDAATDTCIPGVIGQDCLVATPFGPMTLTPAAQADIEDQLAAMLAPMCVVDQGRACDPCLIRSIDLDGTAINDFCCGDAAPGFGMSFNDVVTAIEASN